MGNGTHEAVLRAALSGVRCIVQQFNASLLAFGFNTMLCNALNLRKELGITHFLLLHSDVSPLGPDWLPIMLEEMERGGYGVLSAVIPIKNQKGLTSTAIDTRGRDPADRNPWPIRRLTMHEVWSFPRDSFTGEEAALWMTGRGRISEPILLLNTGLMLIDLRQPFAEEIHFTIDDAIVQNADGTFRAYVDSEDWNVSRQLHQLGVRYAATRKVKLLHDGIARYPNDQAWGTCEQDIPTEEACDGSKAI